MGVDERLHEGLSRVPPADPGGAYERIVERKVRRGIVRKVQAGALTIVVVAGAAGGFVALSRAFAPDENRLASGNASNGRIIFFDVGESLHDIYSVSPDGSDMQNLTNSPQVDELYPNVSPDGAHIAFCRLVETDGELTGGIWVMDVGGGNQTKLTDGGNDECYPTWSPDGSRVAFDGPHGLYVMNADGSNVTQITTGDDWYPAWSPTGEWIAFHGGRGEPPDDGPWADIYLVRPDGSDLRQLTDAQGLDIMPNWSPDGSQIVFMTDRFVSDADTYPPVVALMDADGSNVRQLTASGDGYSEREPFWSPDGTLIGFQRSGEEQGGLFVIAPDGSGERMVLSRTETEACCLHPSWQPILDDSSLPTQTPTPTETSEPTPTETPQAGRDIGLPFDVCDVSTLHGHFADAEAVGTAYVGSKIRDGKCPDLAKAEQVLAVDLDGDQLVDVSYDPLECEEWCSTWATPDVDGDGTDELLVQNIQFSIAGLHLYEIRLDSPEIVPVTVAPPGDPDAFEADEQPQLWLGGDGFNRDNLACATDDGIGQVFVSSSAYQDPPESGPWHVHETTFQLVGAELVVIEARNYEIADPPSYADRGRLCGSSIPYPYGGD